jgi:NAD(P)-dependent dehydrogenase (short-subunit alcohol dehydrogenase family)
MASQMRKFAIVTGASTGIGFELAKICLANEYEVLIAADEPEVEQAAARLRQGSGTVEAVQADLCPGRMVSTGSMPQPRGARWMHW